MTMNDANSELPNAYDLRLRVVGHFVKVTANHVNVRGQRSQIVHCFFGTEISGAENVLKFKIFTPRTSNSNLLASCSEPKACEIWPEGRRPGTECANRRSRGRAEIPGHNFGRTLPDFVG
jgi:hypothetical protein